ncbi:hypothetical protein ETB97_007244 [Aspergillus alliaceus]|uniref:Uncharacterized protein n=1 Tax=Petromyces alliaceus TaxID=209559 RepID=A0A8H5ZZ76_PETAA|nr:hypothetical protein ETB97_007244 [Aspergillus burnettii]
MRKIAMQLLESEIIGKDAPGHEVPTKVLQMAIRESQSAAIGAMITVLAIGVGPFIQQDSYTDKVNIDTPPTTARTEAFNEGKAIPGVDPGDVPLTWTGPPTSKMLAALYGSFFSLLDTNDVDTMESYTSVKPDCPTGNCDFQPF